MIQTNHGTMQCFANTDGELFEKYLEQILGSEGSARALEMMEQESVYDGLKIHYDIDINEIENVTSLVDEINEWIQKNQEDENEKNSLGEDVPTGFEDDLDNASVPIEDDPFADPFADDPDDEPVIGERLYAEAIANVDEDDLERYKQLLSIYEKYTELSIENKYYLLIQTIPDK